MEENSQERIGSLVSGAFVSQAEGMNKIDSYVSIVEYLVGLIELRLLTKEGLHLRLPNSLLLLESVRRQLGRRRKHHCGIGSIASDGQWIAFFACRQLKKITVQGGATATLCRTVTNTAYGIP